MSFFVPFSSFESRLFLARRLAGVPGYQYDVDLSKEVFQRQIFNPDELQRFITQFQNSPGHEYRQNMVFDEKIYLLEVKKLDELNPQRRNEFRAISNKINEPNRWDNDTQKHLMEILDVKHPNEFLITEVDDENYKMYMSDRKFKELGSRDQHLVKVGIYQTKMIESRFMRILCQASLSINMYLMKNYLKDLKH
jgi:hypothetical protein